MFSSRSASIPAASELTFTSPPLRAARRPGTYPRSVELIEALRSTGAVREYRTGTIGDDVVERILETARYAPNGGNRQAWRALPLNESRHLARPPGTHLTPSHTRPLPAEAGPS